MALDGSFRMDNALKEFLHSHPELASHLSYLLDKGRNLTEEELIDGVAELILHPRYTLRLVGSFRPIVRKIVGRAVALLRLVPDLLRDSDDSMLDFDEERLFSKSGSSDCEEVVSVINSYVRCERGLRLHEISCLAFSRMLALVPDLLGSVRDYFEFAPPPFRRIVEKNSMARSLEQDGAYILDATRASYRLLLAKPEVFRGLWKWSCYMNLVHAIRSLNGGDTELLMDIRWSAVQILIVVFKTSDIFSQVSPDFVFNDEEAFGCHARWKKYTEDVPREQAIWYLEPYNQSTSSSSEEDYNFDRRQNSPSLDVGSTNWSNMDATWDMHKIGTPFVITSAVKKSFEMVMLFVSQRWPVLLYGTAGAGKTALISRLAQGHGSQVLSIHMDEQIDGKTLVGSYVCAEQPGEFRWQPGSLTQAILSGLWVVFEDIDKAPADVQSILLPLLESSTSFLTGHGEAITVNEGFRLFATVSSSSLDVSLGKHWRKVMVPSPSSSDLETIVKAWYPDMEPLCGKLIETLDKINQIAGFQLVSAGRFSSRDLLKWCKRIAGLGSHLSGFNLAERVYQEAVDVFAASSSSGEMRLKIMNELAAIWELPISSYNTLFPAAKPVVQDLQSVLHIGRVALSRTKKPPSIGIKPFVGISTSLHTLERLAKSVECNEPVLLVGETGTGKTTLVQNLAARIGQKLTVLNLSQQSDIADLLGGFKPMNAQFVCSRLYGEFKDLFASTFSSKSNDTFIDYLEEVANKKKWNQLCKGIKKCVLKVSGTGKPEDNKKRKRPLGEELLKKWDIFSTKLEAAHAQINASDGMVFSFVEGVFITALKQGKWILLDEINLAPPETLQRVIGVLEDEVGSLCLAERGDVNYISRHPNFRIFACMNPATDAGKRDLPMSLRSRFTEYFMDEGLSDEDLALFINQFMEANKGSISKVLEFYKNAKKLAEERLQDGANQKPQYSLRSLYRALEYSRKANLKFGSRRAIYDGFAMFFLSMLDPPSAKVMDNLIEKHLLDGKAAPHYTFDRYFDANVSKSDDFVDKYELTASVRKQLCNLARAIFAGKYPVLLQGPTSSGKTSLVQYLAAVTGHEFVRINNHEHTDLQEYLGSYITDATGKLVFQEGVLVKAVRRGHWIVLDELNLAPSDVLEALNRLLDDNRELYVPELCETIQANENFMLFATQNPPTFYGGRKMLSRAFRNRFVEIHVDEIPQKELIQILHKRCTIDLTNAGRLVEVMKDLQSHRQSSKVFAGKHGLITPRDLFRWANRQWKFGKNLEDLGREGYYLLAERLRDDKEKEVVLEVLRNQLRIELPRSALYKEENAAWAAALDLQKSLAASGKLGRVVLTASMWRLYFLIERCYRSREPVLLVGETGGGKTTVCQLLSLALGSKLHILNCHQYTETSDFIGGFYPVRERSELALDFKTLCEQLLRSKAFKHFPHDITISLDINQATTTLKLVSKMMKCYREGQVLHHDVTPSEVDSAEEIIKGLFVLRQKWCTIFNWQDGPLVQAMKNGDMFLVDEISLADDSVLERLNSVLEPERKLSLAEKGGSDLEKITAHENFFILATMNPGGDFGKKELSPALRNRFTEIWVPPVTELDELKCIALEKISNPKIEFVADAMINFWKWFNELQTGRKLTVRDLLSWIDFVNVTEKSLHAEEALLHGAFLVLLDGLSLGTGISKSEAENLQKSCLSFLKEQLKESKPSFNPTNISKTESNGWSNPLASTEAPSGNGMEIDNSDLTFGIHPFYIERGDNHVEAKGFEFLAPTTRKNSMRVLRAMQLKKPVLLEGSPGVGKTSLVLALGKFSGHSVVRINLSEQTDMMDLLGSDLPVESDEGMQFAWSDGILLQALKNGSWVLLDELNLAPQSVLEGLNAILDHRAEVFIPELGHTFKCPSSFRVFACQNPTSQGGGRKGLPKSFLNRFTKVYVDELVEEDHLFICRSLHPSVPEGLLKKLIAFNKRLYEDTMVNRKFGQSGSPWEFNLRDIIRSCQIIEAAPESSKEDCFLNTVYVQRMRSSTDRQEVIHLYESVFGVEPLINLYPRIQSSPETLTVGNTHVKKNITQSSTGDLKILPGMRQSLETVAQCLNHQWLVLLIGPAAAGKTSMIRLMSQLTGNVLNELNLSSATDISDLLGCFEQYNAIRHYRLVIDQVKRYINAYISRQIESPTLEQWLSFSSSVDDGSTNSFGNRSRGIFNSLPLLVKIIENLQLDIENDYEDLDRLMKTVRKLQDDQRKLIYPVKFEWVTGMLIKAIKNGEWIILENANLCNPTVLDRINSLVEQSGSITVNECGTVEGKPMVLHPHPEFRMFLTVNPTYGEVSRAMRNRGVEIYLTNSENELEEAKRFLVLSNIPGEHLVDAMANAHLFAKRSGSQHNVCISNLELGRWVQLFQQLLTEGKQALKSLKYSFDNTYLSSLGANEGKDIINEAIGSYLSIDLKKCSDSSLCLPGGHPTPLMVRDFVSYSTETSVRQNCMYMEFLGAQVASRLSRVALGLSPMEFVKCKSNSITTYVTDLGMLHAMVFPKVDGGGLNTMKQTQFDVAPLNKKLLFAANWSIEQATIKNLKVYLLWLGWLSDQSQGYCSFFSSYLKLLIEELNHSSWHYIMQSHEVLHKDLISQPMLSLDVANSTGNQRLINAVKCVGLLRLSHHQWHAENEFKCGDKTRFIPVLESLRILERRILDMLVESPVFDLLFELYNKLIGDHISAWNGLVSSQSDHMLNSMRSLLKHVEKLKEYCANEVEKLQDDLKNLERSLSWSLKPQKSLLWAHGGHPFAPSSVEIYSKQQQLLNLCYSIWTPEMSQELASKSSIEAAVSSNSELRFLAMQGVCMSAFIMSKVDDGDLDVLKQMEEMYQTLLSKFNHEKDKLEKYSENIGQASLLGDVSSCCVINAGILCQPAGLSCWLDTQPLNDYNSFGVDMRLLQELSKIVSLDGKELESGLSRLRWLLESTLKFSLDFSSRPPTDFSPYQILLWILDAWTSVNSAHASILSTVHEMWFNWHTSLWKHHSNREKKSLSQHAYADLVLFQPVAMKSIDKILRDPIGIKDLDAYRLKLGLASRNLWLSSPHIPECHRFFLLSARYFFQQIILAHEKSFEAENFLLIKSIFLSAQQADVSDIISLLASSTHHVLKSLIPFIEPLLRELYAQKSTDSLFDLGGAWLRIGSLRYHLLQCCDDVDPAVKKNLKYVEQNAKIATLEQEIEVRRECDYLSGGSSTDADKVKMDSLNNLKAERNMLKRQVVFRSDAGKYKKLRSECDEFLKLAATPFDLLRKMANLDMQQIAEQVHNWQETATRFVDRLSNEYSEYVDLLQPVQIAIYEMKLGLHLVLTYCMRNQYLDRVGQKNTDVISRAVYSFIRFPRGIAAKDDSCIEKNLHDKLSYFDKSFPTYMGEDDMNMVETLVTSARDDNVDEEGSVLQRKAAIHQNILLHVVHYVAEAHFLDDASFKHLDRIFDKFPNLWMKMKTQVRTQEELDSQQYRFKPRAFELKNIIEMDITTLESSNEVFSEWKELASEEVEAPVEKNNVDEELEVSKKGWDLLESMPINMPNVHNTIFGSTDLLQPAGHVHVSDSDRLRSFIDSYSLGTRVIKDLDGLMCSSSLESKLIPEHVFRLCLEHDRNSVASHLPKNAYNFYKDSNASLLAKMVDPVIKLQQQIRDLLSKSDDHHPALQKIVDVIDMILSIPMNTPVAKAMSSLQFLLTRVRNLQETVAKLPLSDQLDPIIALVSTWQKMEFESWPALLDEVQAQFDANAGKLWFPLYRVFWETNSAQSIMQSLEEFIQTSSIGEFKRRLQLLFAFHGHISTAIRHKSKSSCGYEDTVRILYNTLGFCVQFLPNVMEQLASNRKTIESELNELLKLCKWDRTEWYMTMETSKRPRGKFKKLLQKYTDVLKQPVMLIFTEEAAQRGIQTMGNHVPTTFSDTFDKYKQVLDVACHETLFKSKKRFIWSSTWGNKVDLAMEDMRLANTGKPPHQCVPFEEAEAIIDILRKLINVQSSSDTAKEEWKQIRYTFEKINTNLVNCGELWKDEKKKSAKNRAYSDLLKLLDDCGLAKHRTRFTEDRWYLQPSYSMEHLLLKESRMASGKLEVVALENHQTDWKTANEYFFKSLHSFGHLRDICSKFHQDFELEKVKRSESYLSHLVEIQTKHRASAYSLAEGLERLKKRSLPLRNLFTNSQLSHNQDIVFNCILRQKQLFDTMCSTLKDECLLLTKVESNHLICKSVGAAASRIRLSLEKFIPEFKKSKKLLEEYLFGDIGGLVSTSVVLHPYGITKQMEQFVQHNFLLVRDFKEQLHVFRKEDVHAGLAKYILLDHIEDIFTKGNLLDEYYNSALEARNQSRNVQDAHNISKTEARFTESLRKTCKHVVDGFERVNLENNKIDSSEDYFSNIKTWQETFDSRVTNLQLDTVHDELVKTLNFAGELTSLYGSQETSLRHVEAQLKYLYSLLDLMITFGNGLLSDFMVAHRTLCMVTHVLAEIFASLYKQGFGCSVEDQEDDGDKTQDATGTGMGEGAGAKDVSEQIEDEDQLLGTEKGEKQDASNDVPSKDDKGIEMEQDFNADAFDISEDENDDENEDDTEEPELDSAMGETGDDSEIVDEKLRDNKDDENDENSDKNEKYETGPSVEDDDKSNRELRAKEDDATATDEAGEADPDESNKQNEENDDQAPDDGTDDVEDMNIDKDEAFAEPTGLKPDAPDVGPDDDIDMNQQDDIDHNEEEDATETVDESAELKEDGEESNQENPEENGTETVTETSDMETEENKTDADVDAPKKDVTAPVANDFGADHQSNDVSATQPNGRSNGTSMKEVAPEATWSNTNDMQSDLAPINGLPNNSSENEISIADSSRSGKLNDEHNSQLPELDPSSLQKNEPNPFRNIGDALDGWKERAKVSVDLEEKKHEPMEELMDEEDLDADEYGFTSGMEKGTAQALGPAAADQIDKNIDAKEPTDENGDGGIVDKKDDSEMDVDEQHVEARPVKNNPLNIGNTVHEKMEVVEAEIPDEIPEVYNPSQVDEKNETESLVHMNRSYMTDNVSQFSQLTVGDDGMGMAHDLEDISGDMKDSATALWRNYELKTTQLSHELAEQLRLVMEPTHASKLQGDYKTGKRINMRRVISFIASYFRNDKIWLRRTRPNKRNYQVVIAIDDSSSMSENNSGSVAIEALVTVCRAMSQLEVGSLAVASFGKEGNIQLLHDFDQPFTGEAGVKMLSGLTFKQENTVNDSPMAELLKYLNNTLDSAAMNARLPSGQNPLEQLVIIIADGHFHEKAEVLKRRVNDLLSKNRMVAILILDTDPKNSIEKRPEYVLIEKKLTEFKYMDLFPFPFYVILKDIETLPRTLADLLRQWFELMQH